MVLLDARSSASVKVSVGSWHHLIEHDGIQENETASNQERLNSELLAASEDTSKLRHFGLWISLHTVQPGVNLLVGFRCT